MTPSEGVDHFRLSIVITNFNYEKYLGEAISSALGVDWPDKEIIVVDDGSTDRSVQIAGRFKSEILLIMQRNSGQREAANTGFSASTGDVVLFLDSDDVLPRGLAQHFRGVDWSRTSKVQFGMSRIRADGEPMNSYFPRWRKTPSPQDIRRWVSVSTAHPSPPGSGNAYARWFLERIFPLGPEIGNFADSGCIAAAPWHGDVVTVPDVYVGYRVHGANDSGLLSDVSRFEREVRRAHQRWQFALTSIDAWDETKRSTLRRSRELLEFRIVARRCGGFRLRAYHMRYAQLWFDVLRSPFTPGVHDAPMRVGHALWCAALLLAPKRSLRSLTSRRWAK